MTHRLIQFRLQGHPVEPEMLASLEDVLDFWTIENTDHSVLYAVLARTQNVQEITDRLQSLFGPQMLSRLIVLPVEATLPKAEQPQEEERKKSVFRGLSREELYEDLARGANISRSFVALVILSTAVASIGLLADNIAAVIGAMVIAPLLGPNMALALATALGDNGLMKRAIGANITGVSITFLLAIAIGYLWTGPLNSGELTSRTLVGFDGIVLAVASGAAAVLSLASGTATALVGVMVAVALLPPAATCGILLGAGEYKLALGAALLLGVNVVCVNLAANLVFWIKGVQPRTWVERAAARRAMLLYSSLWLLALFILGLVILKRGGLMA